MSQEDQELNFWRSEQGCPEKLGLATKHVTHAHAHFARITVMSQKETVCDHGMQNKTNSKHNLLLSGVDPTCETGPKAGRDRTT
jgi:hypothetical protein